MSNAWCLVSPKLLIIFRSISLHLSYFVEKIIIMRRVSNALILSFLVFIVDAQVAEMKWELDFQIYLKLANDSNYTYDIREAFHVKNHKEEFTSDFVFYPVNPGEEFADEIQQTASNREEFTTLWNALHAKIGGGWIHFSNCIAYSIETGNLDITSPLMKRPELTWKPSPMTESYKRTRDWEYYVPVSQKNAQKEYKAKRKSGTLGDLNSLPPSYLELFLNTSQKQYDELKESGKMDVIAKIDLIKVILGSNYLGKAQITYMSNTILESVLEYSSNRLPSVIIFDEFEAAAAMSLTAEGYKIEDLVYRSSANITDVEAESRRKQIQQIVEEINDYNKKSFKKRLGSYYQKKDVIADFQY